MDLQLHLALCDQARTDSVFAAFCKVATDAGNPPEWVQLIPAGTKIVALDKRQFANPDPDKVIAKFRQDGLDLPIDWEHATEIKGPKGDMAPAAGWIVDLENRDGSIWAKVEWTKAGADCLRERNYRYISPGFYHTKDGSIVGLSSAGLTNKPALAELPELAHEQGTKEMDRTKLIALFGLKAEATDDEIFAACSAAREKVAAQEAAMAEVKAELATARNATPPIEKYVPRADYDLATARAEKAESEVKADRDAAFKAEVEREIGAAVAAGKVTPATKDFYLSTCHNQDGLEAFRKFVKGAPPVVGGNSGLGGHRPPEGGGSTVDQNEVSIARNCGISLEQYKAQKALLSQNQAR